MKCEICKEEINEDIEGDLKTFELEDYHFLCFLRNIRQFIQVKGGRKQNARNT
ncbi:hypothetical protein ES702_02301 [subsurface metagenome]